MELQLLGILNKYHPGEWEFVGNGKVILNGLNPDFVNVNGKKQIIELFGGYWHKPENPNYTIQYSEDYRIKEFAKLGFKTLVIWDKELKNEVALVSKIDRFTGWSRT
jgi:G:T-mismatch repair DNA endonuclease (very short patch repair protein)